MLILFKLRDLRRLTFNFRTIFASFLQKVFVEAGDRLRNHFEFVIASEKPGHIKVISLD